MQFKKLTIFAGHYGSGKTNLAVNYAVALRRMVRNVAVVDMDIVNPYFRSKDSEKFLNENDVKLISSDYANTNVDVPSITPLVNRVFDENDLYSVLDVGGDDQGAVALGRFAAKINQIPDRDVLLVINKYRPLTENPADIIEVRSEIEKAWSISFTGIVNNSNLGAETTAETVLESLPYANEVSEMIRLPIVFTSVKKELYDSLSSELKIPLFPLEIAQKPGWYI